MAKQKRYRGKKVLGNLTMKFRIGSRKNGKGAHSLNEADLRKNLGSRYHSNVVHVLQARGLTV